MPAARRSLDEAAEQVVQRKDGARQRVGCLQLRRCVHHQHSEGSEGHEVEQHDEEVKEELQGMRSKRTSKQEGG